MPVPLGMDFRPARPLDFSSEVNAISAIILVSLILRFVVSKLDRLGSFTVILQLTVTIKLTAINNDKNHVDVTNLSDFTLRLYPKCRCITLQFRIEYLC